jgi:hypothetical protein
MSNIAAVPQFDCGTEPQLAWRRRSMNVNGVKGLSIGAVGLPILIFRICAKTASAPRLAPAKRAASRKIAHNVGLRTSQDIEVDAALMRP